MIRKNVGVLLALLAAGAMLLCAGGAFAYTLNWNPSTTYTDGTAFDAGVSVTYDVQVDGATVATGIAGTSWPIPQSLVGHNKALSFTARAVLSTGEVSAWAAPFAWTSPPGIPSAPGGLSVTP